MSADVVRVLVVDDSASVRSLIVKILDAEPAIRVVGTAASGVTALDAITSLSPDVVTLDVEMPGMDGIEFLKRARVTHPRLPIIMFSHLTQRGAVTTVDAMFHGATDFVGKPSNTGGPEAARDYVKSKLVPKILALKKRTSDAPQSAPRPRAAAWAPRTEGFPVVAIGSSTGGPVALDEIICALPKDFSLPVVVVQHMPPMFTKLLAERMSDRARVQVAEARGGDVLGPGKVFIAPGDRHLTVRREGMHLVTELIDDSPAQSNCPSVDMLFKSVARAAGASALGVVLTGMGNDALEGSRALVEAGGRVVVQDEASSVVWGMPGAVARAGLAQSVLSVKEIAAEIVTRSKPAR
jgi:two-component system chemotaxis response regulator CheB